MVENKLDNILGYISLISFIVGLIVYVLYKIIKIRDLTEYPESQLLIIDGKIKEDYEIGKIYSEEIPIGEPSDKLTLKSEKLIRTIKIFKVDIDNNCKKCNLKKGDLIKNYKYLAPPRMILLEISIPCGIPTHIIEYQREDYMVATLSLQNNGKNGYTHENTKLKHTLKSIIYHLTN